MNSPDNYPLVSVIMPIRNEAAHIVQSVNAVLEQDYPQNLVEIIIADGMSDDHTIDLIRSLPDRERIRILTNPQKIQAAGLNLAIRAAYGEIIIRVDGHTIIAPDYIRRCVETLNSTGAANVGGAIYSVGITTTGHAIALASRSPFAVPSIFRVSTKARGTDTVYMGAWFRHIFDVVGFFDERFAVNEDYELNYRLRKAGGRIYFSPEICSKYYGAETLRTLARQYFRYGASKPKTLLKHPRSLRMRHLAAPVFVSLVIGSLPLSILLPQMTTVWILTILFYLVIDITFSLHVGRGERYSVRRCIPWVFMTIHAAWGCGFWVAIFRMFADILTGNFTSLS